ncbi:MAG: NlpC/P60 family protein [Paraclostridium sp.]
MKRKILVPMFASVMALSMNGVANADEVKVEKSEEQVKEQTEATTNDTTNTDEKTATEENKEVVTEESKEVEAEGVISLAEFKDLSYKVAVVKEGVAVKVRSNGAVQTIAYTGDEFRIVGEQDDWYKVNLGEGSEGWIASRFVDVKGATGYITADKVNLRKEAHVEAEIQKELELSTKVEVLDVEDNWLKVKKGEAEGYIRNLYVSDEAPVIEEPEVVVVENNNEQTTTNNNTSNQITNNGGQASSNNGSQSSNNNSNNNQSSNNNNNNQSSGSNNTQKPEEKPVETPAPPVSDSDKVNAVINLAYSKLGSPYEWGAEGPNTFDCSGFTSYVFRNGAGVSIPRTSGSQYGAGTSVSKSNLMPGDLVFFSSTGGKITHVGLYVGGGNMIHSPQTGDVVKVSSINSSYYTRTYVGAKRIL